MVASWGCCLLQSSLSGCFPVLLLPPRIAASGDCYYYLWTTIVSCSGCRDGGSGFALREPELLNGTPPFPHPPRSIWDKVAKNGVTRQCAPIIIPTTSFCKSRILRMFASFQIKGNPRLGLVILNTANEVVMKQLQIGKERGR